MSPLRVGQKCTVRTCIRREREKERKKRKQQVSGFCERGWSLNPRPSKDVSAVISASRESFLRKTLVPGIAELYSFDFLEVKKRNIVLEAREEVRRSGISFKVDSNMLFHVLKDNCLRKVNF